MTQIDTSTNAVRALLDGVTPGPWRIGGEVWNQIVWSAAENRVCFMAHSNGLDDERDIATARFIAAARALVPALLAEKDDLRAKIADVQAERDNANKIMDDWTTLHRVIADIRDASGLGSRPMLSELAGEIGKRIASANARADWAEAALAAQIEAGPMAWVIPGDDHEDCNGFLDAMAYEHGEFTRPLYAAQPHDRTALDRIIAATRAKALRDAAGLVQSTAYTSNGDGRSLEPVSAGLVGMDMHHATIAAAILALRDKPAPAVTPKIEVKFTWAKGDEEFWVHLKSPDGKSAGFNLGNPKGMIATALLRAIAGGGDE